MSKHLQGGRYNGFDRAQLQSQDLCYDNEQRYLKSHDGTSGNHGYQQSSDDHFDEV
jgi:hypothetical protein